MNSKMLWKNQQQNGAILIDYIITNITENVCQEILPCQNYKVLLKL